jgi:peptide/nickel transport system permease protein
MNEAAPPKRKEGLARSWVRFRKNPLSMAGLTFLALITLAALLAPWIAPYPQDASLGVHFDKALSPPSREHFFGTDEAGRDIFSRLLFGARLSLMLAVIVLGISFSIGVPLGIIAGYYGGAVDEIIMRVTDVFSSIPALVMAMAVCVLLRPSLENSMIAIALVWWRSFCRLAYGETLSLKQEDFVTVSRSLGSSSSYIMFREILPNMTSSLLVKLTLDAGYAILVGTSISYLGAGASPPTPEWGIMVAEGRHALPGSWWASLFPGLAIFLTVLSFNLLGDGLRDFFDVKVE